MKTKILFNIMAAFFFATILPFCLPSCGDDSEDDGDGSSQVLDDPTGTVEINLRDLDNGGSIYTLSGLNYSSNGISITENAGIFISGSDLSPWAADMVGVGKVKGLAAIKSVPKSGWTYKVAIKPGYGYIVRGHHDSSPSYARIYCVDYLYDSSGDKIGAVLKYECPWEP